MVNAPAKHPILLSIVLVVDRWADRAAGIVEAVAAVVEPLVADYEIVLVDNGSDAASHPVYTALTAADGAPNVQVYRLLQRVDYEVAAWAGVENSLGDMTLVYDPFNEDLSPLADAIADMIEHKRDIVLLANTTPESEGWLRAAVRRLYLGLFRTVGGIDLTIEAAQYRLMSRRVTGWLLNQPRPAVRYRLSPATAGFSVGFRQYAAPRSAAPSGAFVDDVRRGFRLLFANSVTPVRIASLVALSGAAVNILYSLYVVTLAVLGSRLQPGWVTLSLQQSGMFFLFSVFAFVIAEYLIQSIRDARNGTAYFVVAEHSSAALTKRARLNVETAISTRRAA